MIFSHFAFKLKSLLGITLSAVYSSSEISSTQQINLYPSRVGTGRFAITAPTLKFISAICPSPPFISNETILKTSISPGSGFSPPGLSPPGFSVTSPPGFSPVSPLSSQAATVATSNNIQHSTAIIKNNFFFMTDTLLRIILF